MTTLLLDANVLIALVVAEHEHHERAAAGSPARISSPSALSLRVPLVRFLLRMGETSSTATTILQAVAAHPRGRFWPDAVSYIDLELSDVQGHRQVTDVYLAGLAASKGGRLATFDSALAALRPHETHLIAR